ncbi:RNase adapter RapZ [Deinococcus cellulosilyticus]|uniref:Nucleotide-binding protein n=1 Tax=Deinococcus cellulosilyticus (strain DSM 18568 / NBRC 106333 / KACC 11606 / 5516J-15) TaxID=1223518 RepID=A0A511N7Y4_DEIC1|nr:RNase adapter RapZ [Deinococcus cellulosilyticus]GEM48586.1 nucleotide-binding protein [Deinococcus cellulosilyticus NBRC 106333 = KACC 11606]
MEVVIISGLSGSGKNTALKALEEAGFFVMDNLVPDLWDRMFDQALGHGIQKYAFTVDARMWAFLDNLENHLQHFMKRSNARVLFLEASEDVLLQRYNLTRRKHPLGERSLLMDFHREKEMLACLREAADLVVDTTELSEKQLARKVEQIFSIHSKFTLRLFSFGFKHGVPRDADLVLDVRGLPNPFYDPQLRPMTGLDEGVRKYVFTPEARAYYETLVHFLKSTLDLAEKAGRRAYTVAIGCTGGRHRSVTITETLMADLEAYNPQLKDHRDIQKGEY